jgi:hypothetical protein
MMSHDTTNGRTYRLRNFIISVGNDGITALEYVYFEREGVIREISHPAEIDGKRQMLVIRLNNMHGKESGLGADELMRIYTSLPEWRRTRYYQLYDNERNSRFLCGTDMLIKGSRMNFEVLK